MSRIVNSFRKSELANVKASLRSPKKEERGKRIGDTDPSLRRTNEIKETVEREVGSSRKRARASGKVNDHDRESLTIGNVNSFLPQRNRRDNVASVWRMLMLNLERKRKRKREIVTNRRRKRAGRSARTQLC